MEEPRRKFNKNATRRTKAAALRRPHTGRREVKHFKAALAMIEEVKKALGLPNKVEQELAMHKIKPYRSRGKGRGTPSARFGNKGGKYMPHQGARECARRRGEIGWRAHASSPNA